MLYSLSFYLMVILAALLYYVLPLRSRWTILLAASTAAYLLLLRSKWQPVFFALHLLAAYLVSLRLQSSQHRQRKRILATCVSLIPLLLFKFAFTRLHENVSVLFPLGISFYSLQMYAYFSDIIDGKYAPQKNFLKAVLYFSFFPQLIQGPIPTYDQLASQLYEGHRFSKDAVTSFFQHTLWGCFLKFMIADRTAIFVNQIFDNVQIYAGGYYLLAAFLYSLQLYADFSACVHLSQGMAVLFGIHLRNNFEHPYLASSIRSFWRRWHITFSDWLRDSIYIPLGGSRKGKIRKYLNLLLTFLISGLWHGLYPTYVLWGFIHAFYQIAGDFTASIRLKLRCRLQRSISPHFLDGLARLWTFILVTLAWIPFRADTLQEVKTIFLSLFTHFNPWILFDHSLDRLGLDPANLILLLLSTSLLLYVSLNSENGRDLKKAFDHLPWILRWCIYFIVLIFIWVFGNYGFGFDAQDFIYGGF